MKLQKKKPAWKNRIRRLQNVFEWECGQLAEVLRVSRSTIRKWANGTQSPGRKSIDRIELLEKGLPNMPRPDHCSHGPSSSPERPPDPPPEVIAERGRFIKSLEVIRKRKKEGEKVPVKGPLEYLRYLRMISAVGDEGEEPVIRGRSRGDVYSAQVPRRFKGANPKALKALKLVRTRFASDIKSFPITKIQKRHGLSEGEVRILARLVIMDTGLFENPGILSGRDLAGIGSDLKEEPPEPPEGRKYLAEDATLRRCRLIERVALPPMMMYPPGEEAETNPQSVLQSKYRLTEACRKELLGHLLERSIQDEASDKTGGPRSPRFGLEGVILPDSHREELEIAASDIANRSLIYGEWGFDECVSYGKGAILLFGGPPGTGKTMAAEGLAWELGKKILSVSFPKVLSKWVNETEQNIAKVFSTAQKSGALLFIDEADGLFTTRETAMRSFEIRLVNVLLKEVEEFDGVMVLATNNTVALDPALKSRLTLHLVFPMPDEQGRAEIWKRHLPAKLPLSDDVDVETLARMYELSGRDIKQAVLMAARTAAHRGDEEAMVVMNDLEKAARSRLSGDNVIGRIGFNA